MHQHHVTLLADCDDAADAFYLDLNPVCGAVGVVHRTVQVSDEVVVDLDVRGHLVGIEVFGTARAAILRAGVRAEERTPHV